MSLTSEDFKEWKEHPITEALFYHISFIKTEKHECILSKYLGDKELREIIGEIRMIDSIERLELDDLILTSK